MTCEHCDEARKNGDLFCHYCGEKITDEIPLISSDVAIAKHEERTKLSQIAFACGILITFLLTIVLAIEVITAMGKMGFVIDQMAANNFSYRLFLVTPYIVELFRLSGNGLTAYYCILVVAVVASVAILYYKSVPEFLKIGKDRGEGAKHTALYEMLVLFATMMVIELVYIMIVGATSSPIDKNPVWQNMFSLLSASVWEEMITRFLLIGVPIAVVYMIWKRDWKKVRMVLGGFDNFNVVVVALIIISALIFALAHVTSGSWGLWKIFPTFMFGIIAGYLFVRYGLHAAIAMHFLNDYLQAESWLLGTSAPVFSSFMLMIACIVAIPFIYVYGKRIVAFFRRGPDAF